MDRVTIGVDIGGTKILFLSDAGEYIQPTGPDFSPEDLLRLLRQYINTHSILAKGIGIAFAGLVNTQGQPGLTNALPRFANWHPRTQLREFNCPVIVANDVNAALVEESAEHGNQDCCGVIMVGTGIGAAFMQNGKPAFGANGMAGELGYFPVQVNGETRRLTHFAGGAGMASLHGLTGADFARLAASGDPAAIETIARGAQLFGEALAAVINLYNPSIISLGGRVFSLPGYFESSLKFARKHTIDSLWTACKIQKVKSDYQVAARGAIRLVEMPERKGDLLIRGEHLREA